MKELTHHGQARRSAQPAVRVQRNACDVYVVMGCMSHQAGAWLHALLLPKQTAASSKPTLFILEVEWPGTSHNVTSQPTRGRERVNLAREWRSKARSSLLLCE